MPDDHEGPPTRHGGTLAWRGPAPQMKFALGSGPVSVHERVSLALAKAPFDHEDPAFREAFVRTTEKLKAVYRTTQDTVIM